MAGHSTILITGGAGFIGSHTADRLIESGRRVRIFDCLDPQIHGDNADFPAYLNPSAECVRGDVRDGDALAKALAGVSTVFHFAALTGVGQSNYDIKNYVDVNVAGTSSLIEVIVKGKLPVRRIVLSSSRAVYGEGTHRCPEHGIVYPETRAREAMEQGRFGVFCPICGRETASAATDEDRPLDPISIYGWTKKLQEEQLRFAAKTYGLSAAILRYFNVYGSRQSLSNPYTGIIAIFLARLSAGKPISLYEHGLPLRDFVHVSDVVAANLAAAERDIPSGVAINVGTGTEITVRDLAIALAGVAGVEEPIFEDTGEFRIGDIHACYAALDRARALLDFAPQMALQEGLREVVDWARGRFTADRYGQAVNELKGFGLLGRSTRAPS